MIDSSGIELSVGDDVLFRLCNKGRSDFLRAEIRSLNEPLVCLVPVNTICPNWFKIDEVEMYFVS